MGIKTRCCLYLKEWKHQLKVKSVDDKEEEAMTEVLAHTISMLRGRNGSNSSRNLEWDALDTLPPVCPPAECYKRTYTLCSIHADDMYLVLHTYMQATLLLHILHIPCATYMQIAGYRYLSQILTVCWCSASACKLLPTTFNVEQNLQTASRGDARSQQFCQQCTL